MRPPMEVADARAPTVRERVADYVSLTKPRIMLLALLTVLGAMSMAAHGAWPSMVTIAATLTGVACAVGAGGSLNCFIERHTDAKMLRTARRPIPGGRMHPTEALVFGTVLWLISYFILYLFVNPPTAFLTMLAFGSYVGLYTPLKSRTPLCTLAGAIPGAMPPLIGWTAVRGHVEFSGVLLFLFLFVWQMPHFLALALLRQDEYRNAGSLMLPVTEGEQATLDQILLYTSALFPISLSPYGMMNAGGIYLAPALVMGTVFLGLAFLGSIRGADRRWCKTFFLYSIVYIAVLFGAMVFGS